MSRAQLGDSLWVHAVWAGQDAATTVLRRFELGLEARRCAGAGVNKVCQGAYFCRQVSGGVHQDVKRLNT